uniref:Uncharacterized protein n=1 Tax=Vitis vinifera TaxID=29760 RepID=F6HBZ1_VITVI
MIKGILRSFSQLRAIGDR